MNFAVILKILIAILVCGSIVAGVVVFTNQSKEPDEKIPVESTETVTEAKVTYSKVGVNVYADNIQYHPCNIKDSQGNAMDYDFSVIERNGKYGLIDFNGEEILPIEHSVIKEISHRTGGNRLYIGENPAGSIYVVNKNGELEENYGFPEGDFREELCWYNGGLGFLALMEVAEKSNPNVSFLFEQIDTAETIKVYNSYSAATMWSTSAAIPVREVLGSNSGGENKPTYFDCKYSEKWGLVDVKNNKLLSEFVYDEVDFYHGYSDGLLAVKKDGKWGYLDEKGEVVIDFIYDECTVLEGCENKAVKAYPAHNGFILVCVNGKFGFIDLKGNTVIEPIYDDASQVNKDGRFWLLEEGKWELYQFNK